VTVIAFVFVTSRVAADVSKRRPVGVELVAADPVASVTVVSDRAVEVGVGEGNVSRVVEAAAAGGELYRLVSVKMPLVGTTAEGAVTVPPTFGQPGMNEG